MTDRNLAAVRESIATAKAADERLRAVACRLERAAADTFDDAERADIALAEIWTRKATICLRYSLEALAKASADPFRTPI